MRKVIYSGLGILALVFLTAPAWAQRGGHGKGGGKLSGASAASHGQGASHTSQASQRSNKGGEVRGLDRAKEVQGMNTKADTERGFTTAPGLDKAGTHAAAKAAGSGQASSHSKKGKKGKGKS